jgi:GAF domain-containing protein
MSLHEVATLFSDLGRDLLSEHTLDGALALICRRGVEVIEGAEHASVTRGRAGRFDSVGATGKLPEQVDRIQYELGQGPCVAAAAELQIFRTGDLAADPRWPEFGARASKEFGVASMLSVRLFLEDDDQVAAINFYSVGNDAFTAHDETVGSMLATHAASVTRSAQLHEKVGNLQRALQTNRTIGVAIGVMMTQYKITQEQAFDLLRMASQNGHRKLLDVAQDVVDTGMIALPPL